MEIVSLLYVLCVIPIVGIIAAVIMLLKDVHKYRKSFLKRLMITALIALLLLGISLLLLLRWEITLHRFPERFSPKTNACLSCANCEEKLCHHKKQLKSFLDKNRKRFR